MNSTTTPPRPSTAAPTPPPATAPVLPGEWQARWRRFRRSKLGMTGLAIILALYFVVLFAEFFAPYHYSTQFINRVHVPPQLPRLHDATGWHWPFVYDYQLALTGDGLDRAYQLDTSRRHPIRLFAAGEPYRWLGLIPARTHLFSVDGTPWLPLGGDRMGRDLFSRIIYGGRVSLTIGLVGVAISLFIGTLVGTMSGYFGGWFDGLTQRLIELLLVFPTIPLWMALAAALPPQWGQLQVYFGIVTILSLVSWGGLARQVRGLVLSLRERDYVKAARSFGAGDFYIIRHHLIPGCTGHLIVIATLAIPGMILGETALSFLGLGIRPPLTSWGVLLEEAQHVRVIAESPWLLAPALPVLITVVAFNFVGDALRDAFDPGRR
jgi:peptide/nickel transport system permease protein